VPRAASSPGNVTIREDQRADDAAADEILRRREEIGFSYFVFGADCIAGRPAELARDVTPRR